MFSKCPWCALHHPVEQLCHANQQGLTRRSFFLLTSMAAVGAMVRWTPAPLVTPFTPGALTVNIEVDITRFVKQIEIFEREMRKATRISGRLIHATINLHAELAKTEKGNVIELSCDTGWRGRDGELPELQHPNRPRSIIRA